MYTFFDHIKNEIIDRIQRHKTNASFDLPNDITVEQIKKQIESDQILTKLLGQNRYIECRLLTRYQLQLDWNFSLGRIHL